MAYAVFILTLNTLQPIYHFPKYLEVCILEVHHTSIRLVGNLQNITPTVSSCRSRCPVFSPFQSRLLFLLYLVSLRVTFFSLISTK